MTVEHVVLPTSRFTLAADGPPAAVYLMVTGSRPAGEDRCAGLVLGRYRWTDNRWVYAVGKEEFDRRWAEVEHLESAVRLSLSRRVGRLAPWTDWIEVTRPPTTDEAWLSAFRDAWCEADGLGGPA